MSPINPSTKPGFALAPVTAVYGNTDGFDIRQRCPKVAELELDGFRIVVTHGDQYGEPSGEILHGDFPDAEQPGLGGRLARSLWFHGARGLDAVSGGHLNFDNLYVVAQK